MSKYLSDFQILVIHCHDMLLKIVTKVYCEFGGGVLKSVSEIFGFSNLLENKVDL